MSAFRHAESLKRHELKEIFSDVYGGEEPLNLVGVPHSFPVCCPIGETLMIPPPPCAYRRNSERSSLGSSENMAPRGTRGKLNSRSSRTMARVSSGVQNERPCAAQAMWGEKLANGLSLFCFDAISIHTPRSMQPLRAPRRCSVKRERKPVVYVRGSSFQVVRVWPR